MPKLRVPPKEKMDRALTSAIVRWQELTGNDFKRMSAILGVSVPTYYSRMKSPGTFTLDELRAMAAKKVLAPEDVISILGN